MKRVLKILGIVMLVMVLLCGLVYLFLPKGAQETIAFDDPYHQSRPAASASHAMAATGTPWATKAALEMLDQGGNAVDAAIAALLALNVTYGEAASFPGVAPVLVYDAKSGNVESYIGAGTAPAAATIDWFIARGWKSIPENDIWAQLIPASPDVMVALLQKYGTKSFAEVSAPAIRLAEEGFPVHYAMLNNLDLSLVERLGFTILMPYNSEVYLHKQWWRTLQHGEVFRRPELAQTWRTMVAAEAGAFNEGKTRTEALQAVRDEFYQGKIAKQIVDFHKQKGGLFTAQDLADYHGGWEKPLSGQFGPYTIFANQTWSQGAVVPLTLQILDGIDLKSMGHNTPQYIHTVLQAIELAMADREAYFADPDFVNAPIDELLSPAYAAQRRERMTPSQAFGEMPPPGKLGAAALPDQFASIVKQTIHQSPMTGALSIGKDTSYLAIVDSQGNAVSMTPSDFPQTPMVPGTGMTLGNRMNQFRLDPNHPDALQPGKRPRITPNPSMVFKDGKLAMVLGTPGGDAQAQTIVQIFLDIAVFGMDPQQAVEAPRFISFNFPDSFAPNVYKPGVIGLEKPLNDAAGKALEALGYKIEVGGEWDNLYGAPDVIMIDPETGALTGGADPREDSWAEGR